MKLHTKDHRWGISRGKGHLKLQLGRFRIYLSLTAMKPKYESIKRRSFRRQVLEKSGGICAHCGRPLTIDILSVHHVKPRATHPELTYDPDNCVALCLECHKRHHQLQNMRASTAPTITVNPSLPTAGMLAKI